jgi:hypothetical protein
MSPLGPSKISNGPVNPRRARSAANTPFRAALANAHAFQSEICPVRVCRVVMLHTPARPSVCSSWSASRSHSLPAAIAELSAP